MKYLWRKHMKLDNRGSAIVTVIVVTLFISILATTMLFVSGRNYIMKQTDYQNKQSFYEAEKALDKLKELLVSDVDEAYEVAYKDMMRNYLQLGTDDAREKYYVDRFNEYLEEKWTDRATALAGDKLAAVRKFMEDEGISPDVTKLIFETVETGKSDKVNFGTVSVSSRNSFVIQGVQAYYVDSKGFSSYIYTDIALTPPDYKLSGDDLTMNMSENVIYINWRKN